MDDFSYVDGGNFNYRFFYGKSGKQSESDYCNFPFALALFLTLTCRIFAEQMFIMGVWSQIAEYLYLKKKDPERPTSKWIGYMHGINRISLLIFLLCLIILAIKLLR